MKKKAKDLREMKQAQLNSMHERPTYKDVINKNLNRTRIISQVKTEEKSQINPKVTLESLQALHYKDFQTNNEDDFRPSLVIDENDHSEDEFLAEIDAKVKSKKKKRVVSSPKSRFNQAAFKNKTPYANLPQNSPTSMFTKYSVPSSQRR